MIQKVEPHLDELRIKILALAQNVDESENDKQKRYLEICFAGIELIYGLQLIVNDVKNEIEYCLDFEKLSEQARARYSSTNRAHRKIYYGFSGYIKKGHSLSE